MFGNTEGFSENKAISIKKGSKGGGAGCLIFFFSLFFLAGSATLYLTFVYPLLSSWQARNWLATPCEVVSSRVVEHRGNKGGKTYSIEVVYDYEVNGQKHQSNRYHFLKGSSSTYAWKKSIVDQFPPGRQATCFVNPINPADAVINRDYTFEVLPAALCSIFWFVGFGGLFFTIRGAWKKKEEPELMWTDVTDRVQPSNSIASSELQNSRSGPVALKPKTSPITRFLIGVGVAVFWNGIVTIFLFAAANEIKGGGFGWFVLLFMVPFVLIGVALIGNIFYSFFAIFNPRPRMSVNATAVQLGFPFETEWSFSGSTNSIQRLKIFLQGSESATYRRGTSTTTDTSIFAEVYLLDSTNPVEIASGKASITIPFATMHSWNGGNNKIEWTLQIVGEIKFWPDVKESFPIVILPISLS